jgi:serine protease Do
MLIFDLLNFSYIKHSDMNKLLLSAAALGFIAFAQQANAQDEKANEKEKKQSQEIVIHKKGDQDAKITVEINGDKVTINGKPLSEFKDDNITVNKRKITVVGRNGMRDFNFDYNVEPGDMMNGMRLWNGEGKDEPYAFLGVTTDNDEKGARISEVNKESAAEKAGLKTGDIITSINDKKVEDPGMLSEVVRSFKPKEEVTIHFIRDGKENSAKATLGEKKESNAMAYAFSMPGSRSRSFTVPAIPRTPGMAMPKIEMWDDETGNHKKLFTPDGENNFEVLSDMFPRKQKLGLKIQDTEDGNGVKILDVDKDSPAEKAGLKKDDVLTEIGGHKVSNTDEARLQLMENLEKSAYSMKAKRNGSEMNFDIRIPKKLKTVNL